MAGTTDLIDPRGLNGLPAPSVPIHLRLQPGAAAFVVRERIADPPAGATHTWVRTHRRDRTTDEVAELLARAAGVPVHAVGYAGRKDRWAEVEQWFSLPSHARTLPERVEGVCVLDRRPAGGPLRRSGHTGNFFELSLAGSVSPELLESAVESIRAGFPNVFGPQRFGADELNAARGEMVLRGGDVGGSRAQRMFWMNAWQSRLFNQVVAAWLRAGSPSLPGDLVWHPRAGEAVGRAALPNGIPTGPLFGAKMNRPSGAAGERELDVLASAGWTVLELESAARRRHLFGARRPLWTRPEGFVLRPVAPDLWRAEFVLPAGSYATALLYALTGVWPERRGD